MLSTHGKTKDGIEWSVFHNSDWSGDARICWVDPLTQNYRRVVLPGHIIQSVLMQAAVNTVRDRLVSVLEDM